MSHFAPSLPDGGIRLHATSCGRSGGQRAVGRGGLAGGSAARAGPQFWKRKEPGNGCSISVCLSAPRGLREDREALTYGVFRARNAVKFVTDEAQSPFFGHDPFSINPRRSMADVARVAALQVSDPVRVKRHDRSFQVCVPCQIETNLFHRRSPAPNLTALVWRKPLRCRATGFSTVRKAVAPEVSQADGVAYVW
jgi:hypothetical protein